MNKTLLAFSFLLSTIFSKAQLYFPPLTGTQWDTVSPASLGWCPDKLDTLIQFLDDKNSKAFIILKDGKIAVEHYFDTFTQDSLWQWASAGKSLCAFLTGIAQEEALLNINDSVYQYLGAGWTSCTPQQEGAITIRNQLTMTTGLDDGVPDDYCTDDTCLIYLADPGTRWAYHNAPYTLLHDVVANASGVSFNAFTQQRLTSHTGISGWWLPLGYNEIFFSKARSMARFGLLMLNNGIWSNDTLLHDTAYYHSMINTSQTLNESYGYLWWLNGKNSFMLPSLQFVFPGSLFPDAPADLYAALGKDDQIIHVIPSMNMVVMRMGNAADSSLAAPTAFDNDLWIKLNDVFGCVTSSESITHDSYFEIYPNPVVDVLNIQTTERNFSISVFNSSGQRVFQSQNEKNISLHHLPGGIYTLEFLAENKNAPQRKKISISK